MTTQTLTLAGEAAPADALVDHLYCAIDGERLGSSWRFRLTGIDAIEIGRGRVDRAVVTGATMRIDRADPWMSSVHARLVRESVYWTVLDAGARNGVLVNGRRIDRVAIGERDVIELGRSFFVLRPQELAGDAEVVQSTIRGGTATVVPGFARRLAELARVAATTTPILVRGATGSGKERIAALVHQASGRPGLLVPVNCGALPPALIESELFGYRKGAFSGATEPRAGLAVTADRGTLFLDEVAELPPAAQVALLRLLEQKEVRAIGATMPAVIDLRVVAATHRDLARAVAAGEFREDLMARLAGFEAEIPALADRIVDFGIILGELVPAGQKLGNAALRALLRHAWPRNIRELVRTLEQATALAAGQPIELDHLPAAVRGGPAREGAPSAAAPPPDDDRRATLVALLEKHRGNVTRIAAEMGRARMQIQRWLKHYELDPQKYR
ncbi:MAG: sigma 54-interacting transcriptional regulator [Kofleriaceae bacterium]